MKQTAVEWLDEQIEYISIQIIDGFLTIKEFMEKREKLFEQAKEMEKEQIINAYDQGWVQCDIYDLPKRSRERFVDAEDYYNETFKNQLQG